MVDMFFVLPQDLQAAEDIPAFDAVSQVTTNAGAVSERTPFERLTVEPDNGGYDDWDYGRDYYWGGPYWFNPAFPYVGYPYGYFGGGVVIQRSPRFWYGGHGGYHRGGFRGGRGGFHGGGFHGGGFHGGGGHGGGHGGGGHR